MPRALIREEAEGGPSDEERILGHAPDGMASGAFRDILALPVKASASGAAAISRRQWTLLRLRVVLCAVAVTAGIARDGTGGVRIAPTDGQLLADSEYVVAAVVVEDVRPLVGTRGTPPRVFLRVETVLRGSIPTRLEAVWLPPDYEGSHESDIAPPPAWLGEPLTGPSPGARFILLLSRESNGFRVSDRCRYPDTPEKRKEVRNAIAHYRAEERRFAQELEADRAAAAAALAGRRKAWRATATPTAIARSATDADFVGIGRSGGADADDGLATFQITTILKGVRRKPYVGNAYFARVHVPRRAVDLIGYDSEFVLFLSEDGLGLDGPPDYGLAGEGLLLADPEALKVVHDALDGVPRRPPLPLCVVLSTGYAGRLSPDDRQARRARIDDAFAAAGKGRCVVGKSSALTFLSPSEWVADKIRTLFLGASQAVLVSIGNTGEATLSGIRISSDQVRVVFSGEPGPAAASDQRVTARRLLDRLLAAP
jgi:hypothetical protein